MMDPRVQALLDEFEIRVVDKSRYPEPGETRAVGTLERILKKRGEPHLRLVLVTVTEACASKAILDETLLWAASDLILACADFVENRTSDWLALWDALPVGYLQFTAQGLNGRVCQRPALAGMIYERICRYEERQRLAA